MLSGMIIVSISLLTKSSSMMNVSLTLGRCIGPYWRRRIGKGVENSASGQGRHRSVTDSGKALVCIRAGHQQGEVIMLTKDIERETLLPWFHRFNSALSPESVLDCA